MANTYIRVELSSEGETPKQIIERMKSIGAQPVMGDYDFEVPMGDSAKLFDRLEEIHHALKGSKVRYSVSTKSDSLSGSSLAADPTGGRAENGPMELKRHIYRTKLDRWREMGLEVSELEVLLTQDIELFKAASKEFLRTHLDRLSVVRDRHLPDNQLDGEILALLDETGKSLNDLISMTGYSEEQVTLSLGRLISAGSVARSESHAGERYSLVPPPEPPKRRPLKTLPAETDEEAEDRILGAISDSGSSREQIVRGARLPSEQVSKALASLSKKGRIRVVGKGKMARFYLS
jgi:hypothetical protein